MKKINIGEVLINSPKIYYKKTLPGNYNALTLPPFGIFILESEKQNKHLLQHELIHWEQYNKMGLVNWLLNFSSELNKFGYDKAPMEIEARKEECNFCKTNYTQCVRNGKSKTVFNPQFRK